MKYNFRPTTVYSNEVESFSGYEKLTSELKYKVEKENLRLLAIETYPGIDEESLRTNLIELLGSEMIVHTDEIFIDREDLERDIARNLTDDRVFGIKGNYSLTEFIDENRRARAQRRIKEVSNRNGLTIVYGMGASLVTKPDIMIYADLSRWEIQQRYRSGLLSNWQADNGGEDTSLMVKRGYFFEWPVADRHKKKALPQSDYILDGHDPMHPVMIPTKDYLNGLKACTQQPYSLVPFFDPGVWGGHWMQEMFDHRKEDVNLAWSFNGVPEENSMIVEFKSSEETVQFETPGNNIVFFFGKELLGERVYGRYGEEFPIRFNFLDTVGGQNLSLQVHPKLSYLQDTFGAHYTQDESYYIMHAEGPDPKVYLGFKNEVEKASVMEALRKAESSKESFDADKYVYQHPVKKHDHYLIPAGTIHSSGADCVVLEISSTPNRYTFKLWDWGRVDLDGRPRPVHLDHGEENLTMSHNEELVKAEMINCFELMGKGDGWSEEKTGLHDLESIETRRHTFSKPVIHHGNGSVNVISLVEGDEVVIESLDDAFPPFKVHYAQTVIVPAAVKKYRIRPLGNSENKNYMTMKAYIR